jgi:N-acetylglucosaminyldiphosphoundecaprenol N-acetyl-beta-D-mannosaminyltransferase
MGNKESGETVHTVPILNIPFHAMTFDEALSLLQSFLEEPRNHIIATPNPEAVMQARRERDFYRALLDADLRLADGVGILWASKFQKGNAIPERVRGIDTCRALFKTLSGQHRITTAFFLGGAPGVAEAAKENVEKHYPAIRVVGLSDGFLNEEKEKKVVHEINALKPEILLVCMGMPKQELWAVKHRDLPVKLTLCLGGSIDILAGTLALTPEWLRKLGLEWLHRLIRQPSRIKRMMDLPRFVLAVLRESRTSVPREI